MTQYYTTNDDGTVTEHTGDVHTKSKDTGELMLDYGWVPPVAYGVYKGVEKAYDLYKNRESKGLESRRFTKDGESAVDVTAKEITPKSEKTNPLNAYSQEKYGVPLATLEEKTGGPLKSVSDIDIVGGAVSKGGNVSVNTPGAFAQQSPYAPAPVAPQVPAGQFDKSQLGQSPDPLANKGWQQPQQSVGPIQAPNTPAAPIIPPTPSVQAGVESGSPAKAIQSVIAKDIDKTSGMYRDAQGNMIYPEKMSPAARSGYEAFTKQYPDIAKTLESKGQFGILGAGAGDNNVFNSYDSDLMKRLRNEVNQGQMVGPYTNYEKVVNPAIKGISPETAIGKELAALPEKSGNYGTLGTPATIGGKKGGLMTGKNTVLKGLKAGGPALLLMSMADAAKAAQQGKYGEAAVRGADIATDYIPGIAQLKQGLAPTEAGAPGVSKQTIENAYKLGSPYAQTEEAKKARLREKAGAGRGIAPPSAYLR
jgi:hypothetical protein